MTVSIEGKLPLDANVYLNEEELDNAHVYAHLKGYARATVTHLDIEHPSLVILIPSKARVFIWILGIENGILIRTGRGQVVGKTRMVIFGIDTDYVERYNLTLRHGISRLAGQEKFVLF